MRKGFTMIELLVVIAIIAILAAVILSVLARAEEKGRSTQCLDNLRQWGTAFRMYADDNSDYLPRRGQGVQTLVEIDRPTDWFNALPPYFRAEFLPDHDQQQRRACRTRSFGFYLSLGE